MTDLLAAVTSIEAPCWICSGALRVRLDKRSRLFLSCEQCRARLFGTMSLDRAADLLAGAAVLASPRGRAAVAVMREHLGLALPAPAAQPAARPAASPAARTGTDR